MNNQQNYFSKSHPNCANNKHTTNSLTSLTNSSPKPSLGLVTNGAKQACNVANKQQKGQGNNMGSKKGTNVSTISGGYLKEQMSSSSTMCIIMNHINITYSCKPILKFIDIPGTMELSHIPYQINQSSTIFTSSWTKLTHVKVSRQSNIKS